MEAHGSGLFGDIARKAKQFVQKHHLQDIVNPVIHKAKRVGHHAVNRASQYAHTQIDRLQPIEGNGIVSSLSNGLVDEIGNYAVHKALGIHHPLYGSGSKPKKLRKGKGLFGGVLSGAAGLSNLIGGPGSDEASKVLGTIGGIANTLGLGVAHRHHTTHTRKRRTRKGKGILEDIGKLAKNGAKSLAKTAISQGADYLNNQVNGLGVRPKLYKRKQRKYHGGGALFPAGGALLPAGYCP